MFEPGKGTPSIAEARAQPGGEEGSLLATDDATFSSFVTRALNKFNSI